MAIRWKDELVGPQRDASAALIEMFSQWGLESLAGKIVDYVKAGYDSNTIYLLLQDSKEWQKRFAGNEARVKAGLPILNPAEYIATERGYRQAMQSAGMPKGFYDKPDDFVKWMVADISPQEVAERAMKARELVDTVDKEQLASLARIGLGAGDIAAAYLDPKQAKPILDKKIDVALLNAERKRAGFSYSNARAEELYDRGIEVDQAREGYQAIAASLPTFDRLAEIDRTDYSLADAEAEVFSQDAKATQKRQRLASNERGRFSSAAGQSSSTLASDNTFN